MCIFFRRVVELISQPYRPKQSKLNYLPYSTTLFCCFTSLSHSTVLNRTPASARHQVANYLTPCSPHKQLLPSSTSVLPSRSRPDP